MNFGYEKRSSVRHLYRGSIKFSIFNQRDCLEAESVDVCTQGLKFRSNRALKPGTTICIRAARSKDSCSSDGAGDCLRLTALAKVKWCREIDGSKVSHYEVGARYYLPDY